MAAPTAPTDYYETLGVSRGAKDTEVRRRVVAKGLSPTPIRPRARATRPAPCGSPPCPPSETPPARAALQFMPRAALRQPPIFNRASPLSIPRQALYNPPPPPPSAFRSGARTATCSPSTTPTRAAPTRASTPSSALTTCCPWRPSARLTTRTARWSFRPTRSSGTSAPKIREGGARLSLSPHGRARSLYAGVFLPRGRHEGDRLRGRSRSCRAGLRRAFFGGTSRRLARSTRGGRDATPLITPPPPPPRPLQGSAAVASRTRPK